MCIKCIISFSDFLVYVANMKHVLFSTPEEKLNSMKQKYKAKVPDPLNTQFPNKTPRDDAIKNRNARKRRVAEFFPSGKNACILD